MSHLDELQNEAETQRTLLAQTFDNILARLSPRQIARSQGRRWRDLLEQNARENPVQTASAAALLGYPLWLAARAVPLPVAIAGAAFVLSRRTRPPAGDLIEGAADSAHHAGTRIAAAGGQVQDIAADSLRKVAERTRSSAEAANETVQNFVSSASNVVSSAAEGGSRLQTAAGQGTQVALDAAASGIAASRDAISEATGNPLLVAALGLAAGGLLAALFPKTKADTRLLGPAAKTIRERAKEVLQDGEEAVAAAVASASDRIIAEAQKGNFDVPGPDEDAEEAGEDLDSGAKAKRARRARSIEEHHND